MKRFTALALAVLFVAGALCTGVALAAGEDSRGKMSATNQKYAGSTLFSDLKKNHWASDEVSELVAAGIVSGYPDGSFRPGREVTYGEFIKMVYAAKTGKVIMNETKGHWAGNYYYAALAEGYFDADLINEGVLAKPIPRKHMAHIAAYVIRATEHDEERSGVISADNAHKSNAIVPAGTELFQDITAISENSYEIQIACAARILNGYEDGTFGPERTLTRAEAAAVISRLWKYEAGTVWHESEEEKHISSSVDEETAIGQSLPAGAENTDIKDADNKHTERGTITDEVIVKKTETGSGIVPVQYDVYKCNMSDMGIERVEYVSDNTIYIYSSVKHPFVFLMLDDGRFLKPVGFPGGFSLEKEGYHLYVANPEGRKLEDERIYFMFEDGDRVYEFIDFEFQMCD